MKRSRPAKVEAMMARKRQKVAQNHSAEAQKPSKLSKRTRVEASDLPWKTVTLPDRMDDYEGFSGMLEEVDDVAVAKDEATGTTIFLRNGEQDTPVAISEDISNANTDVAVDITTNNPSKKTKSKKDAQSRLNQSTHPESMLLKPTESTFASLEAQNDTKEVDVSAWKALQLSPDTLACLSRLALSTPTPIQQAAIPEILAGHDVIGKASTGSGKTFAFVVPILERFREANNSAKGGKKEAPLALILSPTRELAHQIEAHAKRLFTALITDSPSIATLTGGLSELKQQRVLKDADIIIATPGRLWDMISQGQGFGKSLQKIEFLVIDEADRLLSEGHFKEMEDILNALDRVDQDEESEEVHGSSVHNENQRQTLVFSATFDRSLQKKLASKGSSSNNMLSKKEALTYLLSKLNFREEAPKFIDVNPVNQMASGLKEGLIECAGTEKDLYLYALLLLHSNTRTLVFVNSINAVRRLTPMLQTLDVPALALHSEMPQKARMRSIERFSQTEGTGRTSCSVLIATDVAARGVDIPDIQLVIHYHLPRAADMYVHRSGRTARAGQKGSSVLICAPEEVAGVRKLVATVHAQSALAASEDASNAAKQGYYIRTMDLDRRIVARLKERATLAKKLADANIAKEKQTREDDFLRSAAEELGVDYDSEEFEKQSNGKRGRGSGRKKKERAARDLSKTEMSSLRANLKQLLAQRVNVGVSERYLTSGSVNIDELLRQQDAGHGKSGDFLGTVGNLGLEDL